MSDLVRSVRNAIAALHLLRRGQEILVAVSGGVDSMVLLRVLNELAAENKWRLTIAHLNHQLRGRSSDADERLVRKVAKQLNWPVVVERAATRELAERRKVSVEMAARELRHEFLARVAAKRRIRTIALAHHADDQLELFFLRLLRGSGGEGLAGMKWRNPSPANPKTQLVRPLLDLPKAALRDYAAEEKIAFREDASNASLDFQRNAVRHQLLPLLRANYQPALDRVMVRVMDILGAEAELARQLALEWLGRKDQGTKGPRDQETKRAKEQRTSLVQSFGPLVPWSFGPFEELPVAVQRRCVQLQLVRQGIAPEYDLVEQLRLRPSIPINIRAPSAKSESSVVLRDSKGFVHVHEPEASEFLSGSLKVDLKKGMRRANLDGVKITWRISPRGAKRFSIPRSNFGRRAGGHESFDAERIGSRIVLRHWQPGDRFQPIGRSSPIKLQDLFTNQKIPAKRRRELVLAATAQGEIFWVEGLRISERFKITERTSRLLLWSWHRL